jgi:hypothetical protein
LLSSSDPCWDFVGEGGSGTLEGVLLNHFIVLENFVVVGEAGGVKSKTEKGCMSEVILT